MCGIVGIVEFGEPTPERTVVSLRDALAHRGPDDAGIVQFSAGAMHVSLAHRRLAIVDQTSAGRQPIVSPDGRLTVVFNGEIYNFRELAGELWRLGYRIRTQTDTEIVLAAYEAWGESCIEKFNGMWALAVWDEPRRRLFLARDRLGKKPLYYFWNGRTFAFASEIKSLARHPAVPCRPHDAVFDEATPALLEAAGQSMFADIHSLPAAHALTLDADRRLHLSRYWSIDPSRTLHSGSTGDYVEQFRALFDDAVRLRLRADVPVGAMLSGGLDSSFIAGTIAKLRPDLNPLPTFSARFPEHAACDEGEFIDSVVKRHGLQSTYVVPSAERLITDVERLHYHQETPLESTSIFAQWEVMRAASARDVRVLLDGQGADELLAGYPAYLGEHGFDLFAAGDLVGAWRIFRQLRKATSKNALLKAASRRMFGRATLPAWTQVEAEPGGDRSRLWQRLRNDTTTSSLPTLLRYADRNAMAFGIELRNPFLDYRVVEFLFAIPDDLKIRDGKSKFLLREAGRDRLPPAVRDRTDKIGFATPEGAWLRGPLRTWAERHLFAPQLREVRGYRPQQVRRDWQAHLSGRANLRKRLWPWISTAIWLELVESGTFKSSPLILSQPDAQARVSAA